MQSPTHHSRVTADDCRALYYNIFFQELHAIISSRDYKSRYANLSREDRRKIKENHKEMADNAVRYFIDNNGADLVDERAVNNLFEESILKALEIFK
jgi:hypothetical protein